MKKNKNTRYVSVYRCGNALFSVNALNKIEARKKLNVKCGRSIYECTKHIFKVLSLTEYRNTYQKY